MPVDRRSFIEAGAAFAAVGAMCAWAWHDQHAHQRATKADLRDYMATFENGRKLLGAKDPVVCDFVWKGLPFIVMSEFTGNCELSFFSAPRSRATALPSAALR